MSDPLVSAAFSNTSTHSFNRDNFGLAVGATVYSFTTPGVDLEALTLAFAQTPAETMPSFDSETMEVDSTSLALFSLEDLFKSAFDIFCVWDDQVTKGRFGIKIHTPVQVLGVGTRPYWYVMSDNEPPGTEPNWVLAGDDPSQPYSWTDVPGLTIDAAPASDHTSLTIRVTINDLKS